MFSLRHSSSSSSYMASSRPATFTAPCCTILIICSSRSDQFSVFQLLLLLPRTGEAAVKPWRLGFRRRSLFRLGSGNSLPKRNGVAAFWAEGCGFAFTDRKKPGRPQLPQVALGGQSSSFSHILAFVFSVQFFSLSQRYLPREILSRPVPQPRLSLPKLGPCKIAIATRTVKSKNIDEMRNETKQQALFRPSKTGIAHANGAPTNRLLATGERPTDDSRI